MDDGSGATEEESMEAKEEAEETEEDEEETQEVRTGPPYLQ